MKGKELGAQRTARAKSQRRRRAHIFWKEERRIVTKLNQIDKRTGVGLESWVTCKSQWVLGTIS